MTGQLKISLKEKNNQKEKDKTIFLSPSKLNLFEDCPRCFWLQEVKKIKRPEGPTSTLPRGMDYLIKDYFDKYRLLSKLPPEIEKAIKGLPMQNQKLLNLWRNWRSGLRYYDKEINAEIGGALDECFTIDNYYIPVDYKTRGFALKDDSLSYYQTQLDCYTMLLEKNGYNHLSFGYLIYYIPQKIDSNGIVRFSVEAKKIKTDPKRAYQIFKNAVALLRGLEPQLNNQCGFCKWQKLIN